MIYTLLFLALFGHDDGHHQREVLRVLKTPQGIEAVWGAVEAKVESTVKVIGVAGLLVGLGGIGVAMRERIKRKNGSK